MKHLHDAVTGALHAALEAKGAGLDRAAVAAMLEFPQSEELGDVAFPCFQLAKTLRQAPPRIAAELAGALAIAPPLARVEATGPYLNFYGDAGAVLAGLLESLASGAFDAAARTAAPERVMIEFSQPNTHKVFHVGHLRNVAVGDALQRVHRARGHDVIAANYYGDFGIDVAKCLWELDAHPDEEPPETARCTWLGKKYVEANDRIAAAGEGTPERAAIMAKLKDILERINAGDEHFGDLYRTTRQWCLDEFADIYRWLGVRFDTEFFESQVDEPAQKVVDEFLAKGVFVPSQGAVICNLEEDGLGAALVRKSDGTSLYLTWDLYLAQLKFERHAVERSIYVVGSEQAHHFKQLFATLKHMGYERAADCRHVSYELVMLPEGKMSSRKGNVVFFEDLKTTLTDAIESKMRGGPSNEGGEDGEPGEAVQSGGSVDRSTWSDEQWDETVHRLVVACLRYGMLRSSNTTRVVFDAEAWTNLTGDSGAYLLYSLARISGILRRADAPGPDALAKAARDCAELGEPAERMLLGHLLLFGRTLETVERTCDPSLLATWIYDGARLFSRFYHDCPVLKAPPGVREARLGLVTATRDVLTRALTAIGIEPVDEM